MFVKIVRHGKEFKNLQGEKETSETVFTLHECDRMTYRPIKDGQFILDMESANNVISAQLNKGPEISVYVMNTQGQTIDTYRWG